MTWSTLLGGYYSLFPAHVVGSANCLGMHSDIVGIEAGDECRRFPASVMGGDGSRGDSDIFGIVGRRTDGRCAICAGFETQRECHAAGGAAALGEHGNCTQAVAGVASATGCISGGSWGTMRLNCDGAWTSPGGTTREVP